MSGLIKGQMRCIAGRTVWPIVMISRVKSPPLRPRGGGGGGSRNNDRRIIHALHACTNAQVLLIVAGCLPLLLNPCTASRPTDAANTSNATQAYVFIACGYIYYNIAALCADCHSCALCMSC